MNNQFMMIKPCMMIGSNHTDGRRSCDGHRSHWAALLLLSNDFEVLFSLILDTNSNRWAITPTRLLQGLHHTHHVVQPLVIMLWEKLCLYLHGKTLAVGSPFSDRNGATSGYVRVFHGYDFGQVIYSSLSGDGKTLAIGPRFNNASREHSGIVVVYPWADDNDKSSWKQDGHIIHGEAAGDKFGSAVSFSTDGKTLAIGASDSDSNGVLHSLAHQSNALITAATNTTC